VDLAMSSRRYLANREDASASIILLSTRSRSMIPEHAFAVDDY
jgi:hypothetical protein